MKRLTFQPATHEIEKRLHERRILVVPDFVANACGVISSYAEYIGENPERITKNTRLVLKEDEKQKIPLRDAALKIAQERVREAMEKEGKYTKVS